jgi:hypothetical protein
MGFSGGTMRFRVVATLALITIATAGYAQDVNVDSDRSAPFATYKSFAWTKGTPSPNPLGEDRLHQAVEAQLASKGLTRVDTAPDVYVATHVVTKERQELETYGFSPWVFGGFGTASIETYVQGTLVVDMYDANTKKLIWRGTGTDTASDKPEKNTKKMNKAVTKMFEEYPPLMSSSRY